MVSGELPTAVEEDSAAVGGPGGVMFLRAVIVVAVRLVVPLSSSTRNVALYVPGME